jgi:hypothetical protein
MTGLVTTDEKDINLRREDKSILPPAQKISHHVCKLLFDSPILNEVFWKFQHRIYQ